MIDYKNFIVDLGGVLYKIDESRAINALKGLSQLSDSEFLRLLKSDEFNDSIIDFETGFSDGKEFFDNFSKIFNLKCNYDEFEDTWNKTLISQFEDAVENIKKLKEIGSVVLLSNTNEFHYNKFEPECRELLSLFDKCYFSHKLGMRKPDTEFFKYVVEDMIYAKETTVFIDDSLANVESARQFGLNVFHVKKDVLREFIEKLK